MSNPSINLRQAELVRQHFSLNPSQLLAAQNRLVPFFTGLQKACQQGSKALAAAKTPATKLEQYQKAALEATTVARYIAKEAKNLLDVALRFEQELKAYSKAHGEDTGPGVGDANNNPGKGSGGFL